MTLLEIAYICVYSLVDVPKYFFGQRIIVMKDCGNFWQRSPKILRKLTEYN